jgi:prophage tail gpP-like protein
MPQRPRDSIRIETGKGSFDAFNNISLVQDLFDSSTATVEIGDDGSWREIEKIIEPGQPFRIYCNELLQMTGRCEALDVPVEARSGTVVQLTCRTKMADARYASADPKISFSNVSVKQFILALYAPLGYTAADFQFAPAADVNLMTGKAKGSPDPTDLEALKVDQAKVTPPETIFEAASKHLARHHLIHWDAADGRICVGRPDDTQDPRYRFLCKRGVQAAGNNIIGARRIADWSEVPGEVWVYGGSAGKDVTKSAIRGVAVDLDLARVAGDTGHFKRIVIIPAEGAKTSAQASARAQRELAARSRRKDAWEFEVDGWSFWDGSALINYANNTTCDVDVETVYAGANGRYILSRIARTLDPGKGASTAVQVVAPGILVF